MSSRAVFASRFAAVATTVGSSVGLGNIWRFPYEAGVCGGGAFLICYIGFVCVLGVPLLCAEFCMGRGTRSNVVGAYRKLERGVPWHFVGYLGVLASVLILSFYSVVAGWTLEYLVQSVGEALSLSQARDGHSEFESLTSGWRPALWTILFSLLNFAVLTGGVKRGIERMSDILMPLLFVILVAFCINSVTLSGFWEGIDFIFKPDFSKLTRGVLLSAMGQAFFSLSLGVGGMMTYASYFSDGTRLVRTAGITAGLDTLVAVLAGVMIFPAVFTYGLSPQAGPTLVFEVLPRVFSQMPGGMVWSVLFFTLLVIASLTSTVSISEISISYLHEESGMSRRRATVVSSVVVLTGSMLCALSYGPLRKWMPFGMNVFDLFDYVASNILLPVGGMVCSIFVGWKIEKTYLYKEFRVGDDESHWVLGILVFFLRWICPAAIMLIFLNVVGII
ncbi:MAG: sodium-dependent transporter [Muribaculaceae bacterium]|nr:sodium-dependent transporter [Muribaculaceae bacterium]